LEASGWVCGAPERWSLASWSLGPVIAAGLARKSLASFSAVPRNPGLAAAVVLAVAVCAVLPRLARLVTLAGLVSDFSPSKCMGLGILMVLATLESPSLITGIEAGASCGLLIPLLAANKDEIAFWPGFSDIPRDAEIFLSASSLFLRSSARAAAPVRRMGEYPPPILGDFGGGEALRLALAIVERLLGLCSGRLLFKDLYRVMSASVAE
jgi:hypothetical protein